MQFFFFTKWKIYLYVVFVHNVGMNDVDSDHVLVFLGN
jgi:hypothetical protein